MSMSVISSFPSRPLGELQERLLGLLDVLERQPA